MLVPAILGRAVGVVWQPVFVSVDADEILETGCDASLLVSLQFGQAEHHVALDSTRGDQILMSAAGVVTIDNSSIVVGPVIAPSALVFRKFTGPPQVKRNGPVTVGREQPSPDHHISAS